ncbi:MAG TPA: DUF2071 domain-containing protein [Chthoniobacterales bacterium]|nr:DUF2071 domain-containing protein [Chthoniobacterales bacterium]
MEEWIESQLRERQLPTGQPGVMAQCWEDLLFLHWPFDPITIQQTLPDGLSVDIYQDRAWIGIVPFRMRNVRPVALPFLSTNFLELNLRTYVRDFRGVPGVWFYSLDANNPMAVWAARLFFGLPYQHAEMHVESGNEEIGYFSRRSGSATVQEYRFRPSDELGEAKAGSLEFFLIERYRLFSVRRGQLLTGRIYHSPYQLGEATVTRFDNYLFELDGLETPTEPPRSVLYAARVNVTIYPMAEC